MENPVSELDRRGFLARMGLSCGAVVGLPALLSACGGSSAAATGSVPKTLQWGVGGGPNIGPTNSDDTISPIVMSLGLEALLQFDTKGRLHPRLAQSWRQPDATTFVFELRHDVKFWNGDPLTARDVVYTFRQQMDPKVASQYQPYFAPVATVAADGDYRVIVKLKKPDPVFAYIMAHSGSYIVQADFWERYGTKVGTPGVLTMGTGPYEIVSYTPNESVKLRPNPHYWGTRPAVENVDVQVITDNQTMLLALKSGQIDGTFEFPFNTAKQWNGLPGTRTAYSSGMTSFYLSLNTQKDPWSDVHVRRAVSHATDRTALVHTLLNGYGSPATTIVPAAEWLAITSEAQTRTIYADLPAYPYNLAAARAELRKSRHPKGFSATVTYPSIVQRMGLACQAISENLAPLGIKLDVQALPYAQWLAGVLDRTKIDISVGIYAADYPDPSDMPGLLLASGGAVKNGYNWASFSDPTMDKLLARQAALPRASHARVEVLENILRIAGEQVPYVPIWWEDANVAVGRGMKYVGLWALYYFDQWTRNLQPA